MEYDLVIVGGGPAGLSAAIQFRKRAMEAGEELSVCILEKGSEIGAHILSGAVVDPVALDELIPDWREKESPLTVPVVHNHHWVLGEESKREVPHALMPPFMSNKGCYTLSLGNFCRWLADEAEALGIEIFPGFAGQKVLFHDDGRVRGVQTGEAGVARDGSKKPSYEPGMNLVGKYLLFAEGVRGHLSKGLIEQFDLRAGKEPQVYGIGIKELWDIDPEKHVPGTVIHTQGWPLTDAWGGGFIYHQENNQVAIGFVIALDYQNPHLSPFDEMQRYKTHPAIKSLLEGGRRVAYGARAINEGGYQAIPKLTFPGGALIGCSAGFVNVPRIKGTHTAMKSGMCAADAAFDAIKQGSDGSVELTAYPQALEASFVYDELKKVRNVQPAVAKFGGFWGTLYAGLDMWVNHLGLGFLMPWTFKHHADHTQLKRKDEAPKIEYPKPDGVISFDRLSSVFLSNTNHEEDQPIHLTLKDTSIPIEHNLELYDAPEQRYCPAAVYEIVREDDGSNPRLQINAQNCVHCKTCDIKDPSQNIHWVVPEGGGGPNYPNM
ncbi:MAG: electron transfer flavoprotein-ubiquinone oxidoreductase [Pseudomonadota bacterium]